MQFEYKTKGPCSQRIFFEIEEGKVHNVQYLGGCNGNLQGISKLVEGMDVDEVIKRVEGIHCGMKPTSCPDQVATALKEAKENYDRWSHVVFFRALMAMYEYNNYTVFPAGAQLGTTPVGLTGLSTDAPYIMENDLTISEIEALRHLWP